MKDSLSQTIAPLAGLLKATTALLVVFAFGFALAGTIPAANAQVDDPDAELGNELGEEVGDPPADPAAGDDGAGDGGAAGEGAGDEEDTGPKAPSNLLVWTFVALGIPYTVIFFALSITLLTLIVMNILASRQDNINVR